MSTFPPALSHQQPARNSKAAIAALVLGVLSLLLSIVTAIPAIICGIVGLVGISKPENNLKGMGLAIAGIVLAVLLPILGAAAAFGGYKIIITKARQAVILKEFTNAGIMLRQYALEHDGKYPDKMQDAVPDTAALDKILQSASADASQAIQWHYRGKGLTENSDPATVLLETDLDPGTGKRTTLRLSGESAVE